MQRNVRLKLLEEETLARLLEVAVADADPKEVMPPVDGPAGWTASRKQAFMDFFRPMLPDASLYAITVDGEIAGFMRMKRLADNTAETGMWLGRSWRGKGIGAAALDLLLAEAARVGLAKVVADTVPGNSAALGTLRRGGAQLETAGDKIYAEIPIDPAYRPDPDK